MTIIYSALIAGVLAVVYALILAQRIVRMPEGTDEMNAIAHAIAEGASAFLARQYRTIALVSIFVIALLWLTMGWLSSLAFTIGAFCSALAGFMGMSVAVRANIRTAVAARDGLAKALRVAFWGGSVTGLLVAGLAMLAVVITYLVSAGSVLSGNLTPLVALGFGGSLISVFARLGGGIYTKGADVGTDLVGKIEKGIPEDDPRNPGVIADLVGDNVGDDAGMAADLFETYVVTIVAAILLGHILMPRFPNALLFPFAVGSVGIVASIAGSLFVRIGKDRNIMNALYRGLGVSSLLAAGGFILLIPPIMRGNGVYTTQSLVLTSFIGIIVTVAMVIITEFYTSKKYSPVRSIAQAANTGHGTVVIAGLALSMKATVLPVFVISAATLAAFSFSGLYGVALAVMSMLSLTGIIVAIDAFGPITDNAGGIVEMTNQPQDVRSVTDALDAVGNTTKAVTKGYAIASAGLAALVLFASFTQEVGTGGTLRFSLDDPYVLVGMFIGATLPFIFGALAMEAVGKTAASVVVEVRRQFATIKGLMSGKAKPQYGKAVDIVTRAAIREMLVPAIIPVAAPVAVGFLLGTSALGGLLIGTIVTGLFVAISMTTGGAAWDNAKKYIEEGHFGGKGSPAHQAAVTGDTVGDPYKDTAGPAINPMIKVVNIVALLIAGYLR